MRFLTKKRQLYTFYFRWFTYSFLHVGFYHFFINFVFQILFGLLIEFEHKVKFSIEFKRIMLNEGIQWVRMTIIYVVGVISGSLFYSVWNPCRSLVGSVGGIYALLGKNSSDPIYHILP